MPPRSEVLGDGSISRQESLGVTGGFEPLHAPLTLTRRPVRVLTAIVEVATLAMLHPRQYLALGRPVALQLVGDDRTRYVLQALEQLAEEFLGCFLIAPALHQDIEDVVILIHSSPQIIALTIYGQKDLVQVPLVTGPGPTAPQPVGIVLSELLTPSANGFVGHDDAAFHEDLLYVAVAQGETVVEPDPMADDFAGKAVVLVPFGVGGRGHVGSYLGCERSSERHRRGDYVMGQDGWSTT